MKEVSNDCESTTCGSAKLPGWESWKTLLSVMAYHSFGGEVEASNTPTIRRLIPSCRHQLPRIAPCRNRDTFPGKDACCSGATRSQWSIPQPETVSGTVTPLSSKTFRT